MRTEWSLSSSFFFLSFLARGCDNSTAVAFYTETEKSNILINAGYDPAKHWFDPVSGIVYKREAASSEPAEAVQRTTITYQTAPQTQAKRQDASMIPLVGGLAGTAGAIFGGALVAMFATRWLAGFTPKYWRMLLCIFTATVAAWAIGFVLGTLLRNNQAEVSGTVVLSASILGFFVQSGFYSMMITDPQGGTLKFGKSCLVTLVQVSAMAIVFSVGYLLLAGFQWLSL
jgi:hypothetical protein